MFATKRSSRSQNGWQSFRAGVKAARIGLMLSLVAVGCYGQKPLPNGVTQGNWKSQNYLYTFQQSADLRSITINQYNKSTRAFDLRDTMTDCRAMPDRPNALQCYKNYSWTTTTGHAPMSDQRCRQTGGMTTNCDPLWNNPDTRRTTTGATSRAFVIELVGNTLHFWIQARATDSYAHTECVRE
ncbi:MAG: hypothetical protein ABI824_10785 [Acidobacteriota bacterium]